MKFEDLKIGMKDSITKTITETDVILYSGIKVRTMELFESLPSPLPIQLRQRLKIRTQKGNET